MTKQTVSENMVNKIIIDTRLQILDKRRAFRLQRIISDTRSQMIKKGTQLQRIDDIKFGKPLNYNYDHVRDISCKHKSITFYNK